jgi:lipoate-protein ligase A
LNLPFCRNAGIEVVRRITGGKAVLHHHEITYSLVSNDLLFFPESDILGTYEKIARGLQAGLAKLGLATEVASGPKSFSGSQRAAAHPSCFATANHHEILLQGRKLVGSAQRRAGKAFLQHGSILLDYDAALWVQVLGRGLGPESPPPVATLHEGLPDRPAISFLLEKLAEGFEEAFETRLKKSWLPEEFRDQAFQLASQKYI